MAKLPYLTGPREPGKWYLCEPWPFRRKDDQSPYVSHTGIDDRRIAVFDSEAEALAAKGPLEKQYGYRDLYPLPPEGA